LLENIHWKTFSNDTKLEIVLEQEQEEEEPPSSLSLAPPASFYIAYEDCAIYFSFVKFRVRGIDFPFLPP
jgi:hypothetical protein